MKKDELVAYWNTFVQKWAEDPEAHFLKEENVFKNLGYIDFDPFALPEPYFGDPNRNSAVILNYNPGPVMAEYQLYKGGRFLTEGRAYENYYEFAKPFPYLTKFRNNPGGKWWLTRKQWIDRLSSHFFPYDQEKHSKLRPFALEICPWHSKSFKLRPNDIRTLSDYITQFILGPAEEISQNSLLPIIVSIGKDYYHLFQELGFKKELTVSPDNYRQFGILYPEVAHRAVFRYYSVWRSPSGGLYLNTYSPGSNSCPKAEFAEVEKFIISKLCSLTQKTSVLPTENFFMEALTPSPKFQPTSNTMNHVMREVQNLGFPMTKRNFRQSIINAVAAAIREMGLEKYIETPTTSARKSSFDAHVKLSSRGKGKYTPTAANPSKQIIHPDLGVLKITDEACPANFVNNMALYEEFALTRLNEFISDIKNGK